MGGKGESREMRKQENIVEIVQVTEVLKEQTIVRLAVAGAGVDSEMGAARRLAYRFLELPHRRRLAICQLLGLVESGDVLEDAESFYVVFRRARERGLLGVLWEAVAEASGARDEVNPFPSGVGS
jgi:hypothetical protein